MKRFLVPSILAMIVAVIFACNKDGEDETKGNAKLVKEDYIPEDVPVTGVKIITRYNDCYIGGETVLTAEVIPANATNKNLRWKVDQSYPSNCKVEIDDNGRMKVINWSSVFIGAYIRVTTEDGGFTDRCLITIKEPIDPVPIDKIAFAEGTVSMYVGQEQYLLTNVEPPYSLDVQNLTYTSEKAGVAMVDNDGKVKAIAIGETTITVKSPNGKTATCKVIVNSTNPAEMQSEDLQIDNQFPDRWSTDERNRANTAKTNRNLTKVEKEIYYYMNLCRMKPKVFAETYATLYKKSSGYYTSLIEDLNKQASLGTIGYSAKQFDLAYCYAKNGGAIGKLGHDRSGTGCTSEGKNAECVCWKSSNYASGLDIVMQFLIDEGVPNLGHRKVFLNGQLKTMGASVQPSSLKGQFVVLDFSYYNE